METNLNIALNELKLNQSNYRPNLSEVLNELKLKEANYYRSKVIVLSEAILKNPNNSIQHAELSSSLNQLERLLTA